MKFVADESLEYNVIAVFRAMNHDVLSISESSPPYQMMKS